MPRKKKEINPKQGERLQVILKEQKISQKELSEKIHLSEKTISAMINGRASITYETANNITKLFPSAEYRYQWILGYDDYPTNQDYILSVITDYKTEKELLGYGIFSLVKVAGYNIASACKNDKNTEKDVNAVTSGYVISRDDQIANFNVSQFYNFANKINDYVDFELQHIIKNTMF